VKTKGISIVERHGEKAIVGVFAALALGVVAWQFVGSGNRVTIEGNQKVEPDRAFDAITRKAGTISGQLADPNPAAGIPDRVPDVSARVNERMREGLQRADDPLPVALGLSASEFSGQGGPIDDARYAAVELPALTPAIAAQYLVTLNPLVVVDSEALTAIAPAQQPFDIRAVSAQATFSGADVRAMLEADPDGSGPLSALPRTFWLNRTAVFDVRFERQAINNDGTLGPIEVVPRSPRAESFADLVSPGMSPGEFQTLVRDARAAIGAVVQPPFPPTIAGDIWAPPAQVAAGGSAVGGNPELARLQTQLQRIERERDELEARLDTANNDQARTTISNRIAALQSDIDKLELRILALDEQDKASATSDTTPTGLPEPRNIEASSDITVVAHDLAPKPGATYRYRITLGMTNPLFPWAANLLEDQQSLAQDPIVYTEPSEWSDPVRVAPQAQVFFTRASGGQDAAAVGGFRVGDASAEVFGLYYGHWRNSSSRLAPGDTLAATIDLPEGLKIFEIGTPEDGPATIVGNTPAPSTLTVALEGAMLVDVIEKSAGAARPDFIAVVRLPDGRLVLRDTASDLQDPALAKARRSSEAGRTATIDDPVPGASGRAPAPRTTPAPAAPSRPATATPRPGSNTPPGGRID
jgi:hypothetical protein